MSDTKKYAKIYIPFELTTIKGLPALFKLDIGSEETMLDFFKEHLPYTTEFCNKLFCNVHTIEDINNGTMANMYVGMDIVQPEGLSDACDDNWEEFIRMCLEEIAFVLKETLIQCVYTAKGCDEHPGLFLRIRPPRVGIAGVHEFTDLDATDTVYWINRTRPLVDELGELESINPLLWLTGYCARTIYDIVDGVEKDEKKTHHSKTQKDLRDMSKDELIDVISELNDSLVAAEGTVVLQRENIKEIGWWRKEFGSYAHIDSTAEELLTDKSRANTVGERELLKMVHELKQKLPTDEHELCPVMGKKIKCPISGTILTELLNGNIIDIEDIYLNGRKKELVYNKVSIKLPKSGRLK